MFPGMHLFGRLSLISAALALPAAALVNGPYTTDPNTVHLYHLDESAGSASTANAGSAGRSAFPCDGNPISATPPAVTSIFGAAAFSGFGNAADFGGNTDYFLGYDATNPAGYSADTGALSGDAITLSTLGINGSNPFTLEALVKPAGTTGSREIISTDSSAGTRGFQFRLVTGGATGQQIEFNLIGVGGTQKFAAIPNSGTHAFATGSWFHVAFTFDGTSARFYWTKVDPAIAQANLVSTQTLSISGGGSISGPLVLGNENRGVAGEGLNGAIDEVRISNVARTAAQFIFSPNLPGADLDADGLPDDWETTHFGDTASQDGTGDPDGDFAKNLLEYSATTDPNGPLAWPDTDTDLMNDGWEIHYFTDLSHNGTVDSDSDGSLDKAEHDANTDPVNPLWSPATATLANHWNFNGNLNDTSNGATATLVDPDANPAAGGGGVLSGTDVLLGGGARTTSAYLKLGSGGLLAGRKTPVTIELWATRAGIQNWGRIFDFGSGSTEYLFMSWTRGTTSTQDRVEWKDVVTAGVNDTVAPYTTGIAHHIVLTIEPRAGAAGTTRVTWYAAPAGNPSLGAAQGTFDTANTLNQLNDSFNYLGRSQYAADNTANARYDDFRIWDGALTLAEREAYHLAGPDATLDEDSDNDDLPDAWEMRWFRNLNQTAGGDPDDDDYLNDAELDWQSDPTLTASTPLDRDADGLADTWEIQHFGSTSSGPTADPDGDGDTNLTEQASGSAPNHRASNSTDVDADALPDAWELTHFTDLTSNGGSDPDKDGFGNLQEHETATHPANVSSRPPGTAVRLVPLDDGNNATSDFGYAGASAINSVAFVRSSIKTVGNQQFITWYGRHQHDAAAAFNDTIWIGRRTLGSSNWEIFRHPSFTANTITDGHDVISYGIDGDGYMHVSWGMHGDAFHYSKSTTPVTGSGPITLGPDTTMTGTESSVTYPQFLKLPGGDLLFIFREVASGNGDTYINRYSIATQTWANVHGTPGTQNPFIKGTGWTPNYNAYPNMPQLGGPNKNELVITWCWRYEPVGGDSPGGFDGYQTNNNLNFARSPDGGATWRKFNGTSYSLPITRDLEISAANKAEIIMPIPEGSSLINQASTCLDQNDNPVTCTWWAPNTPSNNYRRQYMVVFRDDNGTPLTTDDTWQTRTVSNRATDPTGTRYAEDHVRDLGRPVVVNDDADRVIVAYRDNQSTSSLTTGLTNGLTVVHSLPKADDPHRLVWIQFDLTNDNLGNYEPIIDNELWDRDRQLHFLYQAAEGQGYTAPANLASRFSVLEWNAASYFAHSPQAAVAFSPDQSQITITCPSQPSWGYRLWSSPNLTDWSMIETRAGTGQPLVFTQAANAGESKRFWRVEFKEGGF